MEQLISLLLLIAILLILTGFTFVLVICFMQIKALEYLFKTFVLIDGTPTDNFDVDIRPKTTNQTRTIELPATKADQDQYTPTDAAGQDLPVSKFTPDPKRKLKVKVEQAEGLESFSEEGTP